jgi:acyl-coenzyme A synthetase/AMP-(fatty) acid ligase
VSAEGKILLGLTVGGAIVAGTLPELLIGLAVGYIVYICHSRMVNDELDQIIGMVDAKLSTMDDGDKRRKQLEQLRTKAAAKKETATLGSSIVAVGAALCPPAGLAYIAGRWAWKQKSIASASAAINRRIEAARRPTFKFC